MPVGRREASWLRFAFGVQVDVCVGCGLYFGVFECVGLWCCCRYFFFATGVEGQPVKTDDAAWVQFLNTLKL